MSALPATMREMIFDGAGGPEVIKLREAAVPTPGPGKVLVEVVAAGINRPDCIQRAGLYPPPPGESDVPGLEIAGRSSRSAKASIICGSATKSALWSVRAAMPIIASPTPRFACQSQSPSASSKRRACRKPFLPSMTTSLPAAR